MRHLLEAAGFTDIEENPDHTLDATREGIRYKKIHMSGMSSPIIGEEVITQEVDIQYEYAAPETRNINVGDSFVLYCKKCKYHLDISTAGVNSCPECGNESLSLAMGPCKEITEFIRSLDEAKN
jgi:predicted RNA-binding Zn-ribbon protein involved in translation (DUF1610 family)